MSEYISDRELGPVERSSEEINEEVWNAFVSIFDNLVLNNSLSISFPESCPDGQGICGCNTQQLEDAIKAEIPKLPVPIRCSRTNYNAGDLQIDKYAILDFLEFLAKYIKDVSVTGRFHDFFNHYHYCQNYSKNNVNEYRDKVNTIFARNGVVFYLDSDGAIKRTIPHSLNRIITGIRFSTNDHRLNELLEMSCLRKRGHGEFPKPPIERTSARIVREPDSR